tara:strand:+ start:331 stop:1050 length:720 start_codon:yes stop_codon:yes gene_type:complete
LAWIKSDESLSQHPKVDQLAETLDVSSVEVIGHLHYLWWWALSYSQSGDLTRYEKRVGKAAKWTGDNDFFVESLIDCGWLDRKGKTLKIHDWNDYHGALMEKREKATERKRKERVKKDLDTQDYDRKEIFNTVIEVTTGKSYSEVSNEMTTDSYQRYNSCVTQLIEVNADEQEIRRRAMNYFIKYGERPTAKALVFNWLNLDVVVTEDARKQNKKKAQSMQTDYELQKWAEEVDNDKKI